MQRIFLSENAGYPAFSYVISRCRDCSSTGSCSNCSRCFRCGRCRCCSRSYIQVRIAAHSRRRSMRSGNRRNRSRLPKRCTSRSGRCRSFRSRYCIRCGCWHTNCSRCSRTRKDYRSRVRVRCRIGSCCRSTIDTNCTYRTSDE